jgi:hypothetical protein
MTRQLCLGVNRSRAYSSEDFAKLWLWHRHKLPRLLWLLATT